MTRTIRILSFLSVAVLSLSAFAEDEAPATYASELAKLAAPSQTHAFSFEGEVVAGGNVIGTMAMSATPSTDGAAPTWKVALKLEVAGGRITVDESAIYDAHLMPISGRTKGNAPDGPKDYSWTFADGKVAITNHLAARTDMDASKTVLAHEGAFQSSLTTVFLFCRLIGQKEGTFKTDLLVADESKFVSASVTCGATGSWGTAAAKLVKGTRSDGKTLEAGFDATTGALLGGKLGEGGQTRVEFRKPAPKGYFDVPATSAQQAAAQAGLAFAVADFELLERVTHWPSLHAKHTAEHPDQPVDAEGFRALLMQRLRVSIKPQGERAMIAPTLESMAASFETVEQDGHTVVKFGPMFRNLMFHVDEFDGVWYLVQFPDKPK